MPKEQVSVDVQPPEKSVTNWTAIAGLAASVAAYFGLSVDPQTLVTIILGIQALQSIITVIRRTFFTKTVTPAVADQINA